MQLNAQGKSAYVYWGILLLNVMLFLVWPLAHTIALRKLLLVMAAIAAAWLLMREAKHKSILMQPWLLWMGALLVWVILHAAFISQNGAEAWKEFTGQWVPVYVAMLAGIGMALAGSRVNAKWFGWLLLIAALALPVFYLIANLVKWWQVGYLPIGYMSPSEPNDVRMGTDLKTSLTFSLEMLVAFSCAKLLEYWKSVGKFSLRTPWALPIILGWVVVIVSLIKNFMLLLALSIILLLLIHGFRSGMLSLRRLLPGVVALVLALIVVANSSSHVHELWLRAVSDTRVAWDIDQYPNWKNNSKYGIPQNEVGETLSETYYLRLAFAHAGFRAMLENPWGYGVTRKAMERLEQKKDPEVSLANAHNGYLNMACAVGIPALALFVFAMGAAFGQLRRSASCWAMSAIWMTGFYLAHWMLDAIDRDHFFEMFMYVVALMLTLAIMDDTKHAN